MLAASVIAATERCRRLQRHYFYAELGALLGAVALGAAAVVAVVAERRGSPLPTAAVAIIAAMLGASLLGAVLMLSTPAVLRAVVARVDVARAAAERVEETQRGIAETQRQLAATHRQMLVEIGRLRMAERDEAAALRMLQSAVVRALSDRDRIDLEMEKATDKAFQLGYQVRDAEKRGGVVRLPGQNNRDSSYTP